MRLIACALLFTLLACGQKGQLYLPPPETAGPPPSAEQAPGGAGNAPGEAGQAEEKKKDKSP